MPRYFPSIALAATIISAVFLYSCSDGASKTPGADTDKNAPLAFDLPNDKNHSGAKNKEPAKLDLDSIPDVIAEIENTPVKKDEFVRILKTIQKDIAASGTALSQERVDQLKASILTNIVNTQMFLRQAKKENVTIDNAMVDDRIALIKKNFPSEEAFEKMLKERGSSIETVKKNLTNSMIIQSLIKKNILSKIEIPEAEVKEFYDKNQLQFESKDMVRASHILVKVSKDAKAKEKEKAFEKAQELRKKLDDGSDFAKMAEAESDDPGSARNGGDLGFFERGRMVPEFEKAAFATEPGKISPVVETQFGYHILKVIEKKQAGMRPYNDVKDSIQAQLKRQKSDKQVKDYIERLKKEMNVKLLI
ncbi:Survival protein SurA precursor (Peptidyl-prolyl cis-trans isomerase SurA) [hydrothermal vent metagenome]|uniref:Survival protein SurA (Peptidyl-prolyl cis-trans isomerase SurA) n=1 Tax=hydrothermal vent metagenome TaxID=652676 RepID=A0A3B1CKC8_9ZZZZ